ncbi:MAG: excinuclease ABC subunit UvrC [Caldisericaceae bacterium]|nr:excinuclease ABC subunit UvrC [Caldisericaceae bacterium]
MQNSVKFPDEINLLPLLPGVYVMHGEKGEVLYVGKAKSLRKRVSSYVRPRDIKTKILSEKIKTVQFVVASSEEEALLLENNLIKKHKPKYNIRLVDDENYPYIKITNDRFPKLLKVYRINGKNGEYFGPFPHGKAIDMTIKAIRKIFPVRTCNIKFKEGRKIEPCLLYHLGLCVAPCAGKISEKEYLKIVNGLKDFLKGSSEKVLSDLYREMERAKRNLEFEKAAIYRDQIKGILSVMERQRVVSDKKISFDLFATAKKRNYAVVVKIGVREGKVVSSYPFVLKVPMRSGPSDIIKEFLLQNPFHGNFGKIYVEKKSGDYKELEDFLSEHFHSRIKISVPRGEIQKSILEMAKENAKVHLNNYLEKRKLTKEKALLEAVQKTLGLKNLPVRIEGYDISNVSGKDSVGSMVVFTNGKPDKKQYRIFKIKFVEGPNDFAMLKEVLYRRFKRKGDKVFSERMPDLLLIDGGKGQLDSAIRIKKLLNVDVEIASLAKKEELVFVEGRTEPLRLSRRSEVLKLLQRVRDESHRFAKKHFTKLHGSVILNKNKSR